MGTARGVARVRLGPARGTPPRIPGPPMDQEPSFGLSFSKRELGGWGSGHPSPMAPLRL